MPRGRLFRIDQFPFAEFHVHPHSALLEGGDVGGFLTLLAYAFVFAVD